MRIALSSIFVDDQANALKFYTDILGFTKVNDIDLGEFRWLTVATSAETPFELVLEPNAHPAAKTFQQAIYAEGIPMTAFYSENINEEYERLLASGVSFKDQPAEYGGVWTAIFDDTVGNWIQLVQA